MSTREEKKDRRSQSGNREGKPGRSKQARAKLPVESPSKASECYREGQRLEKDWIGGNTLMKEREKALRGCAGTGKRISSTEG